MIIAFSAHKGGFDQSNWQVGTYNFVTWPALSYNRGNRFVNGWWTPVEEGEPEQSAVFSGQLWMREKCFADPGFTPNYVARVAKNGDWANQTICAPIGINSANFPGSFVIPFSVQDIAQPGDRYGVYLYATYAGAILDGHPFHTWFSGSVK